MQLIDLPLEELTQTSHAKTKNVPGSSGAALSRISKKTHPQSQILGTSTLGEISWEGNKSYTTNDILTAS